MESDDVIRASAGDRAAFQRIVRGTIARAKRVAGRIVAHDADALDVVQEAYARAFVALREGQFRGTPAQMQSWLDRIVARAALDALRQRKRSASREDRDRDPDTTAHSDDPARSADAVRALAAVRELGPDQRAAFVLRELEGLSIRETAEALGCSDGAVEQRVLRAWAALRRRFSP
jgi:RNA polymerase sigma-70 factor (ECF subfamily)